MTRFTRNLAAAAAALGLAATAAQADISRITIGTNPQGTMYYVVGGGVATLFSDALGIRATVQPGAGASVYLPLIDEGDVTMGLSSSLDSNMAWNGIGPYEGTGGLKNLRAFSRAWPLPYAYVARRDSGIRTMADLRGERVAVNFRANAALEGANRSMFVAAGVDPDTEIEAVTISGIPEGYQLLTDGTIAAAPTAIGIPLLRQAEATIPGGVVVLGIEGENANTDFISGELPGMFITETLPGENNPGVLEPTTIAGFDAFFVIGAHVSDDDVYNLLKAMWDNWANLQQDFPVLRSSPAENLASTSNTLPFHPGAVRFFREVGLWTDANDARDAAITAQ
ncbi:MAG: TAXI family TRAP transporter solute-binding subunit [Rhodobacteraceae bacterium]|nr:TAXI family TRAP transporter solute-binding subunit [Paracoccaceae bacterium]